MKTVKSITLITGFALAFIACSNEQTSKEVQKISPLVVETITIKQQEIPIWKTFTGKTKASSDQEIRARVTGVLQERYFKSRIYLC